MPNTQTTKQSKGMPPSAPIKDANSVTQPMQKATPELVADIPKAASTEDTENASQKAKKRKSKELPAFATSFLAPCAPCVLFLAMPFFMVM